MQEIKERLYTIEDVLSGRTALHGPLAPEFCFLQLRIIDQKYATPLNF
jgi:hypothetical protein